LKFLTIEIYNFAAEVIFSFVFIKTFRRIWTCFHFTSSTSLVI